MAVKQRVGRLAERGLKIRAVTRDEEEQQHRVLLEAAAAVAAVANAAASAAASNASPPAPPAPPAAPSNADK